VPETVALLAFVTLQRGLELIWSRRNERRLFARGGVEYAARQHPPMVLLHAAWLAALWLLGRDRPLEWAFAGPFLALQPLRYWVLATLGARWSTRVIVLPGVAPVARGPYRLLRHPNYLVVALEIVLLPLAVGLAGMAVLFGGLNLALLAWRIHAEARALADAQKMPIGNQRR
jgi:methyltransferase